MSRNKPSQLLAGSCIMLAVFPLWYWFSAWVNQPFWVPYALTGGSLALGCIAWLHRRYGFPLEKRSLLLAGILARLVCIVFGCSAWFMAHYRLPTSGSIVCGVLTGGIYLIAWEIFRFPPDSLLSAYAFILMSAAWFVGLLLCVLQGSTPIPGYVFLTLAASAGIFTAAHSILKLRNTTEGRDVPSGFYGYNALLLGGFLVISGAVLLGGNQLVLHIGRLLAQFIDYLKRLAQWVTALMLQGELYAFEDDQEQSGEAIQSGPVWLGYAIEGIVLLIVLVLLWRFRREFWDFLKQILGSVMHTLRHLVALKASDPAPEEHPEYTDSVELLTIQRTSLKRKPNPLREARKRYRRTKEPRQKFRAGYAVWLLEIKARGAEFPGSAVPDRILEASGGIPDPVRTAEMTSLYYRIRYGTYTPSPAELQLLDSVLKELR